MVGLRSIGCAYSLDRPPKVARVPRCYQLVLEFGAHAGMLPRVVDPLPKPSGPHVSARMRRTRRRDTEAELRLRAVLYRRGYRYRVDQLILDGSRSRPDIVFRRARLAVFVDGCFWHGCPVHATWPQANANWWRRKLDENLARDRRTDAVLRAAGWLVVRVWEHEDPESAADRVEAALTRGRRAAPAGGGLTST